ncbi:MAG: PIN domain-containing protein [Candidatus Lokiarchaeota archaeon]|nr:PIN domain-containing protein [Candidatus Lokiarchaeota archaeon]MBD3198537.1 PIN domain-containing protein [Candidatus Lokiarchaeota archaeon]
MKIIETDVTVDFLRGENSFIKDRINELVKQGKDLRITQITLSELWYGVHSLKNKQKQISEGKKLNNFIIKFPEILTLNVQTSKIYGEICAELDKQGQRVPQFDLLNAAIAINTKSQLITRDKSHFPRINALSEFDFLELWD